MVTKKIKAIFAITVMSALVMLVCACKSQTPILTSESTFTKVTQREVPVPIPKSDILVSGKIVWDRELGVPIVKNVTASSTSGKKPVVNIEVDTEGNLLVDFEIPSDTLSAVVSDTTTTTVKEHIIEVEKELSWWQQTLIYVGLFVVVVIIVKFVLRYKFKNHKL